MSRRFQRELEHLAREGARRAGAVSPEAIAEAVVDALVEQIGANPPRSLEDAVAFGQAYTHPIGRDDRLPSWALGAVYTPATLARRLVALLRGDGVTDTRACDPACGGGALLFAWLEAVPEATVVGRDTDPQALRLAERVAEAWLGGDDERRRLRFERADLFEAASLPDGVVLLNPPFGTVLSPSAQRRVATSRFAGREPDAFALAFERVVDQAGARSIGAILPDVTRMQSDYAGLRRALTQSGRLSAIEQHAFGSFRGVTVQPSLITLRAEPAARPVSIRLADGRASNELAEDWLSDPDCRWRPGNRRLRALWERCAEGARPLGEVAACHEGVHTGNVRAKLFTADPGAPNARPMYKGADVQPFACTFRGRFLRYTTAHLDRSAGDYASLRDPAIFEGPKLLSRQTTSRLTVCRDDSDSVTDNTLHTVRVRAGDTSLDWLAIVLNSALLRRLYHFESGEGRRPLPQVKLRLLRQMPIRRPQASAGEVAALHDQAASEVRTSGLRSETRARLNGIVFDSYGVPELDRKWLLAEASGPRDRGLQ